MECNLTTGEGLGCGRFRSTENAARWRSPCASCVPARRVKQEEVGEVAGLGRNYLTNARERPHFNPSFEALVRLSYGLGIPLSELIET